MEVSNPHGSGGRLAIASEAIEKIASHAAMEVDGVADVGTNATGARSLIGKIAPAKPVQVELNNEVADVTISLLVEYGTKIPELSERVQSGVKSAIQNMTGISVAKVDVIVTGIAAEENE